ncbi:MAG: lipoate--protein ligase family protein [marine benthic group bacterium]|nr:lipoate--protein ligase family protein [Gemmatimonadota bacterium]
MIGPTVRLLVDGPLPGATNMAVDEALMEGARRGQPSLRLYRWSPGCLSFGRNQTARDRYDGDRVGSLGYDVVRRPTGGRSVLHHREVTYAVVAPEEWGSLSDAYLRINRALANGLRELGVAATVHEASAGPAPRPTVRACFCDPLPGELTSGGRKLAGSAQWRFRGALLQHGSLLLHNDQALVETFRSDAPPRLEIPAVGLVELLGREPEPGELESAIAAGFERELGVEVVPGDLTDEELERVAVLRPKYEDPAWTWRR